MCRASSSERSKPIIRECVLFRYFDSLNAAACIWNVHWQTKDCCCCTSFHSSCLYLIRPSLLSTRFCRHTHLYVFIFISFAWSRLSIQTTTHRMRTFITCLCVRWVRATQLNERGRSRLCWNFRLSHLFVDFLVQLTKSLFMCTWSECISFISQFKRQTLQFWMPHYWKVFASRSWKKDRDKTHREYQTNRSTMTGCWKTQKKLYVRQCKATEKEVASVNLTTFQHTKKRERCESITIFNLFFLLHFSSRLIHGWSHSVANSSWSQPHYRISEWIKIYNRNENQ